MKWGSCWNFSIGRLSRVFGVLGLKTGFTFLPVVGQGVF